MFFAADLMLAALGLSSFVSNLSSFQKKLLKVC
jgi:hypothetical protein